MAKSFLDRFSPYRQRSKVIDWPFETEGEKHPQVRISVLGEDLLEAAALATADHFRDMKHEVEGKDGKKKEVPREVGVEDPAFMQRERVAQVFYAYVDVETEQPLAKSVDELAKQPRTVITTLWRLWATFQSDVAEAPTTKRDFKKLVDDLKKNIQSVPLEELSSTELRQLIVTLVEQSQPSQPLSAVGS